MVELGKIQVANHIGAIFSIFENKLKSLCDKLNQDFEFEKIEKKAPYIPYYWKVLQLFLEGKSKSVEKFYTPIYNKYVVRNVLQHQNSVAEKDQFERFNHMKNIWTMEIEDKYYIHEIDKSFCDILLEDIKLFFKKLLEAVKEKTNVFLTPIDKCSKQKDLA